MAPAERKGVRIPAWLLSTLLHAAVLLAAALLVRGPSPAAGLGDEPTRRASVVMTRQRGEETEYFRPSDAPQAPTDAAQENSPELPETPRDILQDVLPLPEAANAGSSADEALSQLLAGPDLSGGGAPRVSSGQNIGDIVAAEMAQRRGSGGGPQGPTASMSLFGGAPSQGRRFVFVVDRSKSMGSSGLGGMRAVEEELERALELLESNHRFNVIAYNNSTTSLRRRGLVDATPENREKAEGFFARIAAFGATNHARALYAALGMQPDVVYLFTDGGDPYLTPRQLNEFAAIALNSNVTIHTVQFGLGARQNDENAFLQRLADMTHGGFTYVDMARR